MSQCTGTMRFQLSVTNSRMTNSAPLTTHSTSSDRCSHRYRLIRVGGRLVLNRPVLVRVQYASGRRSLCTIQPDRMSRIIMKKFRPCCHCSHHGAPVGAPSGSSDVPG